MPYNPQWSPDDTIQSRENKRFGPDENSETAVRVISENIEARLDQVITLLSGGGGGGSSQILEKVPFSITIGQENTWIPVPLLNIVDVADVNVFNDADYEEIICDIRLVNNAQGVEIRTTKPQTLTVHVEGYE